MASLKNLSQATIKKMKVKKKSVKYMNESPPLIWKDL